MPTQFTRPSTKRFRPRVPLEQRKRIVKACTSCRLRKRRCIVESSDRCRNCNKTNSSCIFEPEEDIPGASMSRHSSRASIDYEDVIAKFNELYPEIGLKEDHLDYLLKILMDSCRQSDSKQSSNKPEAEPITALPRSGTTTSGVYDAIAQKDFLASATEAVSQTERPDFPDHTYPANESYSEYEDFLMRQILKDFPSQAEAEVLIAAFFSYAEANVYYFDKTSLYSQLSTLYRSGLSTSAVDVKFICLALTVFSLGSQFAHLHQASPCGDGKGMSMEPTGIPGARYFRHALHLLPRITTYPSLEGVLSCLLAGLYALPLHNANICYTYVGLALRIAICLGLHRKSAGYNLPPQLSEIRNRVFWTTYTIERRIAISLGYPEMLQRKDIDCPLPQRRADLDSPDSLRVERLVAYTKLSLLLDKAIQSRALDKYATKEIQRQLLAWKSGLPAALTTLDSDSIRLNVHLQLHYCIVWTYISRSALISRVRSFLCDRQRSGGDISTSPETQELSESCIQHAEQIIDLIKLLRDRRQLGRFSHTDIHCCSSATIIILLESILHPRLTSYSRVSTAMDALHFMACGNDFARNTLKHVDKFQAMVNKALATMSQRGPYVEDQPLNFTEASDSVSRPVQPQARDDTQPITDASRPYYATPWEGYLDGIDEDPATIQPDYPGFGEALFDNIGALLEDCSFTNQHLPGYDALYADSTPDYSSEL